MKIISKYTIEDCIFIATHINNRNQANSNFWVQLYSYFIFINCFAFSAFVFYLGYYLLGTVSFLINLIFLVYLGDKIKKESYKAHYQNFFLDEQFKENEVELLQEGVSCKSIDGNSFFHWQNILEIVETPQSIYFFTKANGFTIAKNSFDVESNMHEFLIFAKARIPQSISKVN